MRPIKSIIILLIIAWFLLPVYGQDKNLNQILENSDKPGKFPESPVYHFFYHRDLELNDQGIVNEKVHHFFQILNQKARDEQSNYRIKFNKASQEIVVITSDTVIKEGGTAAVEKGGINEVTPPELADASMYSNIVDCVYSFQKTRPGDGIHIDYEKHDLKKLDIPFSGRFILFPEEPGENISYSITAPQKIVYKTTGKIDVEEKDNRVVFKVESSPFITLEPFTLPLELRSPIAYYSETKEWPALLSPLSNDMEAKSTPDKEINVFVKNLLKNAKNNPDKIHAIYNFMTKNINKIRIPVWLNGHTSNNAGVVLKNRYADPKDGAALMLAMLKSANFKAYPVLCSDSAAISEEIPNLDQYDRILVVVEIDNKWTVLNPFSEYGHIDSLLLSGSLKGKILKPGFPDFDLPVSENSMESTIRVTMIDENHARFKIKMTPKGYCDWLIRAKFYYESGEERTRRFQEIAQTLVDGAVLKKLSITNLDDFCKNIEISMEIESDNPTISQKQITFFTLPTFTLGVFPYNLFQDKRKNDLYLFHPVKTKIRWEISLEKGAKIIYYPESTTGKSPDFKSKLTFKYDEKKSTAVFEKEIENLKQIYSPEEYNTLKSDLDNLEHWKNNTLLWEKTKK